MPMLGAVARPSGLVIVGNRSGISTIVTAGIAGIGKGVVLRFLVLTDGTGAGVGGAVGTTPLRVAVLTGYRDLSRVVGHRDIGIGAVLQLKHHLHGRIPEGSVALHLEGCGEHLATDLGTTGIGERALIVRGVEGSQRWVVYVPFAFDKLKNRLVVGQFNTAGAHRYPLDEGNGHGYGGAAVATGAIDVCRSACRKGGYTAEHGQQYKR